jgi:hypothetical protein
MQNKKRLYRALLMGLFVVGCGGVEMDYQGSGGKADETQKGGSTEKTGELWQMTVISAEINADEDGMGAPDPYVSFYLNDSSFHYITDSVSDTHHPRFAPFPVTGSPAAFQFIKLWVMDEDEFAFLDELNADDNIGQCLLALSCPPSSWNQLNESLQAKGMVK